MVRPTLGSRTAKEQNRTVVSKKPNLRPKRALCGMEGLSLFTAQNALEWVD